MEVLMYSKKIEERFTEEEFEVLREKVYDFLDVMKKEGYEEESIGSIDLEKIEKIYIFLNEHNILDMKLDVFPLSSVERQVLIDKASRKIQNLKVIVDYVPEIPEDFKSVEELKKSGIIEEPYWGLIPDVCNACGEKIISNYNLTIVRCSNLRCTHNLTSQMRKLAVKENITGMGKATCFEYIKNSGIKSVLNMVEGNDAIAFSFKNRLENRKKTYAEWVQHLSFPGINAQANTLFEGINSYEEYMKEVNNKGSVRDFCLSRLGGEGKQADNISAILLAYNYELENIERVFQVGIQSEKVMYLAMTGNVTMQLPASYGRVTKQKYLDFINSIYPEYISFRKTESVSKANLVVSDYPSGSAKYLAGKSQNKLVTSQHLLGYILSTEIFIKNLFPNDYEERIEKLKEQGRCFKTTKD